MLDDSDGVRVKHTVCAVTINLKQFITNLREGRDRGKGGTGKGGGEEGVGTGKGRRMSKIIIRKRDNSDSFNNITIYFLSTF